MHCVLVCMCIFAYICICTCMYYTISSYKHVRYNCTGVYIYGPFSQKGTNNGKDILKKLIMELQMVCTLFS